MIFISNLLSSMLYSSIMTSSPMVKAIMVVATLPSISSDFIATMSVPSPRDNLAAAEPVSRHLGTRSPTVRCLIVLKSSLAMMTVLVPMCPSSCPSRHCTSHYSSSWAGTLTHSWPDSSIQPNGSCSWVSWCQHWPSRPRSHLASPDASPHRHRWPPWPTWGHGSQSLQSGWSTPYIMMRLDCDAASHNITDIL